MSLNEAKTVIVVQERGNPSTDYFILPLLTSLHCSVEIINHYGPIGSISLKGKTVIFVRYVPARWKLYIKSNHQDVGNVIFFMDDDLFDLSASMGMPLRYRVKLFRLAARHQKWLRNVGAQLWVSTPFLAQKYAEWKPECIQPLPLVSANRSKPVRVFYHGSASHNHELRWLKPIIAEVLARLPYVYVEIIGNAAVKRLYNGLDRVTIVHPMSWQNYLAFCQQSPRDIGLAPLLPNAFNAARSHTKFFDIARCHAVGVYSNCQPFEDFIDDQQDGILLENDVDVWVEHICRLAEDATQRDRLFEGVQQKLARLGEQA